MYTNDDIQAMLVELNGNKELLKEFCILLEKVNSADRMAIMSAIKECWYEEFDRYDSDVCETFLNLFEKVIDK